ncbi:TonB-dependent receptor [Marinobacteraceae bacterium S3BR75-40.1]
MRFNPLIPLLSLAVAGTGVSAEELDPVVVTPARTAQTANEANASVSVFTREDIEQSAAQTLDELLQGVPGVSVTGTGGLGKQTGLFLRGTESNHTLVMIDGVRMNTGASGAALIQHIPLSQVERVEVVRGPRSSLYGSDALGGVVHVFTRQPEGEFQAETSATVGGDATAELTQFLGGQNEGTRWDMTLSNFNTDGFDARVTPEPDDDGYHNQSISTGVEQQVNGRLSVGGRFYRAQGDVDFDPDFAGGANNSDFVEQTIQGNADYLATDTLNLSLDASQFMDRSTRYVDTQQQGPATVTKRNEVSLVGDQALGDSQMATLGLTYSEESFEGGGIDKDRYNHGVFGQLMGDIQRFNYQASLRYDNNEQFGEAVTGNLVLGYRLHPHANFFTSYGTAFVTPTFNDLYYPGFSNPNLEPEEGKTVEVGMKGKGGRWRYSLTSFYSEVDELIAFAGSQPFNVNETHLYGGELTVGVSALQWWFEVAAGYTRAINDQTEQQLIRRPKWTGRLTALRDFGDVTFRTDLRGQSESWDTDFSTFTRETLPGFLVADFSAIWNLRPELTLEGKLKNAFDQEATTVLNYNTQGRQLLATLRYSY